MTSKNFTIRLGDDLRAELSRLARDRSNQIGRPVSLADIISSAIEYGMPVVERETTHQIVMPFHIRTKTEQAAYMASALVRRGIESYFSDGDLLDSISLYPS